MAWGKCAYKEQVLGGRGLGLVSIHIKKINETIIF